MFQFDPNIIQLVCLSSCLHIICFLSSVSPPANAGMNRVFIDFTIKVGYSQIFSGVVLFNSTSQRSSGLPVSQAGDLPCAAPEPPCSQTKGSLHKQASKLYNARWLSHCTLEHSSLTSSRFLRRLSPFARSTWPTIDDAEMLFCSLWGRSSGSLQLVRHYALHKVQTALVWWVTANGTLSTNSAR